MEPGTEEKLLSEVTRLREEVALLRGTLGGGHDLDRAQWLTGILAHAPDVICILDLEGRLLYVSRTMGRDIDEVLGKHSADFLPPGHRETWIETLRRVVATCEPETVEVRSVGDYWWNTRVVPVRREGRVTALLTFGTDVTGRKRAESQLALAQSQLALALEASGMGRWRWNAERNDVVLDPVARGLLGWTDGPPVAPAAFLDCLHPDDRERAREHALRSVRQGRAPDLECRVVLPDGAVRWILAKGSAEKDAAGAVTGLVGGVLDVTRTKENEAEMRHAQKLEAIGQLAAGVAHDFNNLLVAIMLNVGLAKRTGESDRRGKMLDDALSASRSAAELTRQLLAFGRRQPIRKTAVDLGALVGETVRLLRRVTAETIDIEYSAAPASIVVLGDRGQLEQLVMNLCINARDAMPTGGLIVVETSVTTMTGGALEPGPADGPARAVRLAVRDTGTGIPPHLLDRVFEPYFTTKEHGTGLGLATVYGIVKQHGGVVQVESEPGRGTAFKVYLPVAEQARAADARADAPAAGGRETILVAEDEEPVRTIVVRLLEAAGYSVLTAADGAEAVEIFRRHAAKVDLVMLDAAMPRMSGAQALAQIRSTSARVAALMSSGYAPALVEGTQGLVDFLPKPYEPDVLLRAVRELLDRARPPSA